jgi:hypothetical protein
MKKLFILLSIIANYSFGQSITLIPNSSSTVEVLKFKKTGLGLDHRNANNTIGVGTYAHATSGYIQTHTNHDLGFRTNNTGDAQMVLTTAGKVGIGFTNPSGEFWVNGNALITGNLENGTLLGIESLTIGGGTTINKFIKTTLTNQQIAIVAAGGCLAQNYTVSGVGTGDTVVMNVRTAFSNLSVENVRATGTNQVEVMFCNISNANTPLLTGISMSFWVIK